MKVKDKVYMNRASLIEEATVTIVAFGLNDVYEPLEDSLFEVIFEDSQFRTEEMPSTMYKK